MTGRYVLLEHQWNGVHWDFLLEEREHLRTWALSEPIAPGCECDAAELPPHRTFYLTYEGPVSHGRGVVRRVDAGTFEILHEEPAELVLRLEGGQVTGEVVLRRVEGTIAGRPDRPRWRFRLSGKVD